MKTKLVYIIGFLAIVLLSVLGIGMGVIYAENKETAEIVDLIERGERLLMPSVFLNGTVDGMDSLDDSSKEGFVKTYLEELESVYIQDSAPYQLRLSALNSFLEHELTTREISYDFVEYNIESIEFNENTATVQINFVDSIRSVHKSENGSFDTIVSQSNNKLKVSLLKNEEKWKISSCEVLDYQSIVDEEASGNEEFSDFDDAKDAVMKLDVEVDAAYLEEK